MSTQAQVAESGKADKVASQQAPQAETALPAGLAKAADVQRAHHAPQSLTPGAILRLQRTVGNRAVTQLLGGHRAAAPLASSTKAAADGANDSAGPSADPVEEVTKSRATGEPSSTIPPLTFSAESTHSITPGGAGAGSAKAVTLTADGHSPGSNGTITVTLGATGPGIASAAYESTGKVKATGGTDAEAQAYEAGYIQTITTSAITATYVGTSPNKARTMTVGVPKRDALVTSGAPWYDPNNTNGNGRMPFTKTGESLSVKLWDKPQFGTSSFPWDTPDGKSKLDKISGKDAFTTWMIARQTAAPNAITYLKWETWHMDYGAEFDYASKGTKTLSKTTGETKNTGSGDGQGSTTPVLSGTIANNDITLAWVT